MIDFEDEAERDFWERSYLAAMTAPNPVVFQREDVPTAFLPTPPFRQIADEAVRDRRARSAKLRGAHPGPPSTG